MFGTRDDIEAMIPKVNKLASNKVVVMVDPISTGCTVAFEALQRGYKVICMWPVEASPEMKEFVNDRSQNRGTNTDEAVAYSAAVQVGILSSEGGQDFLLLDVTPSLLGSNCRGVMTNFINSNTRLRATL